MTGYASLDFVISKLKYSGGTTNNFKNISDNFPLKFVGNEVKFYFQNL